MTSILAPIAIAHDYLLQRGGAERVVAAWSDVYPDAPITTLGHDSSRTFPVFSKRDVRPTLTSSALCRRIEVALPALPAVSARTRVSGAAVALVSTSGWAHRFAYDMPTIAYVHSPARWLYAAEDYRKKLGVAARLGLTLSRPLLVAGDSEAMRSMSSVVVNSVVSRDRLLLAYGIDAPIVHPPVQPLTAQPAAPAVPLPERFALVISRNRGYKNISLAVRSCVAAGVTLVIAGAGTEEHHEPESGVIGLGFVSDSELRWLYRNAVVVIGSAHEDFGLTPIEANYEGTPVAAIPVGGYLETVVTGVNGVLAREETPAALASAVVDAVAISEESCRSRAADFSIGVHMRELLSSLSVPSLPASPAAGA